MCGVPGGPALPWMHSCRPHVARRMSCVLPARSFDRRHSSFGGGMSAGTQTLPHPLSHRRARRDCPTLEAFLPERCSCRPHVARRMSRVLRARSFDRRHTSFGGGMSARTQTLPSLSQRRARRPCHIPFQTWLPAFLSSRFKSTPPETQFRHRPQSGIAPE